MLIVVVPATSKISRATDDSLYPCGCRFDSMAELEVTDSLYLLNDKTQPMLVAIYRYMNPHSYIFGD